MGLTASDECVGFNASDLVVVGTALDLFHDQDRRHLAAQQGRLADRHFVEFKCFSGLVGSGLDRVLQRRLPSCVWLKAGSFSSPAINGRTALRHACWLRVESGLDRNGHSFRIETRFLQRRKTLRRNLTTRIQLVQTTVDA